MKIAPLISKDPVYIFFLWSVENETPQHKDCYLNSKIGLSRQENTFHSNFTNSPDRLELVTLRHTLGQRKVQKFPDPAWDF